RGWAPGTPVPPTVTSPPVSSPPLPPPEGFHDCPPEPPAPSNASTETSGGAAVESPGRQDRARRPLPELDPLGDFDLSRLLGIHRALIELSEGRTDALAVLTLPLHFEKRRCIEWQEELRKNLGLPARRMPA